MINQCKFFLIIICIAFLFGQVGIAGNYYPNGVYLQVGGGFSNIVAKSLKLLPAGSYYLAEKNINDTGIGFLGSLGYQFNRIPLGFDVEYMRRPRITYNRVPVVKGVNQDNMVSHLTNLTLLFNGYYNFHFFQNEYFVPFLTAGVGTSTNTVYLNAHSVASSTTTHVSKTIKGLAWQAGLGFNLTLTNNIVFRLMGRYVSLGKAQWGPWSAASGVAKRKIKAGSVYSTEGILEFAYFFGDQTPKRAPRLLEDSSSNRAPRLLND